jgi:methionine-R-sulfoxide reductase
MLNWKLVLERATRGNPQPARAVAHSDAEWRARLTPDQYQVTRQHATERPFSSSMCSLFEPGRYACVCCDESLFDAEQKFESGTGWPSFSQPLADDAIAYISDTSYGMQRIETVCNVCKAHLGHVFPDGPAPSGLRYCMNALALRKVEK